MIAPFVVTGILFVSILIVVPFVFWGLLISVGWLCKVSIDRHSWVAEKVPRIASFCYPSNQQKKHL